ncbi:MAG: VOC family protein [Chloroflexi bacterium]|nr:VOC family protein [Chloroflexota bacterium]
MAAGIFKHMDVVIIRVRDVKKSQEWYEKTLGFKISFANDKSRLVVFKTGGKTGLCLWQLKRGERLPPRKVAGTYPNFFVEDLEKTWHLLEKRGVKLDRIVRGGGGVKWFVFYDPDGNRLEAVNY